MLKIINNLQPFFEDCYRRINVREYAKIQKISPPTASKQLEQYHQNGLLKKEAFKKYLFYCAHPENKDFIDLSRVYWRKRLLPLIQQIEEKVAAPTIILFGSLAKAEAKDDSDVDIAVFGTKKHIDTRQSEKKIQRKIQLFMFEKREDIPTKELANNIINGYVLSGRLK